MNALVNGRAKSGEFERIAPRLYSAHRERVREIRLQDLKCQRFVTKRLKLQRLIAHRELQLQRAYVRGKGDYIDHRRRKLKSAQRAMKELVRNYGGGGRDYG